MRILANERTKALFLQILGILTGYLAVCLLGIHLPGNTLSFWLSGFTLLLGILLFAVLVRYFRVQEKILEDAVNRIRSYSSGDLSARLDCDQEGELYRLFHEVNSLASALNAQAENETRTRAFLKETISNISHQLKTPLAALNIYNGILQQDSRDEDTVVEFTRLSEQELDRIESLVQNLLKIAKWDSGTIQLEKKPENLGRLLEDIYKQFVFRARQENKHLIFSGQQDVVLCCDRSWLIEAIGNLVKNSLDHTKAGDTVQVQWKQFASVVQITVQDNGCGIHPEDLPHIFKRFYRSRFSQDTQGVGLGLPLAKAVVEAHSGTMEVDSDLNQGASFTMNFLIPTKL